MAGGGLLVKMCPEVSHESFILFFFLQADYCPAKDTYFHIVQ